MKKFLTLPVAVLCLLTACQKKDANRQPTADETPTEEVMQRCASQEILEEQMKADPEFRKRRQELEANTARILQNKEALRRLADGTIEIPVVVHVLYRTTKENISDDQIASQIEVLNADYQGKNSDINKVPAHFATSVGSSTLSFKLDQTVRKATKKASWSLNDDMKYSARGGSDAINPATTLNIWVVSKMTYYGQTILGYAQFPGGEPSSDGVVIAYNYFGKRGTLSAPYNLGRTATHEVGHWLNLNHIWGDATCGSDNVDDTPVHNASNGGCPSETHRSTCTGTPLEMWMNYMDYTYDQCMYMFTKGQFSRMTATFATGGGREGFAQ